MYDEECHERQIVNKITPSRPMRKLTLSLKDEETIYKV